MIGYSTAQAAEDLSHLSELLLRAGWRESDSPRPAARLFCSPDDETGHHIELVLPRNPEHPQTAPLIAKAVETLESVGDFTPDDLDPAPQSLLNRLIRARPALTLPSISALRSA